MIDVILYIVVFVVVIISVGFVLFFISTHQSGIENAASRIDQQNKFSHQAIQNVHHKIDHDLMNAQSMSTRIDGQAQTMKGRIKTMIADFDRKVKNINASIQLERSKLQQNLATLQSGIDGPLSDVGQVLKEHQQVQEGYQRKVQQIGDQLQNEAKLFEELKTMVNSKTSELAALKKKVSEVDVNIGDTQRDFEKLKEAGQRITRLAALETLTNRLKALEERASGFNQTSFNDAARLISEYKDVLPRLNTLPTDYVTKTSFQMLEKKYQQDLPNLAAQVQVLKTKTTGNAQVDNEISKAIQDLQTELAKLKEDIHHSNDLLNQINKVRELDAKVGSVNLVDYKAHLELLPKMGSAIDRIGNVNIAQYKNQLPLLTKLPNAIRQMGDANLALYKDQLAQLSKVPDISTKAQQFSDSLKRINEDIPNMSKIIASLETLAKSFQSKIGNTQDINNLQNIIRDHKKALSVRGDYLVANNAVCIDDICMSRNQLNKFVGHCPRCSQPAPCPVCK